MQPNAIPESTRDVNICHQISFHLNIMLSRKTPQRKHGKLLKAGNFKKWKTETTHIVIIQ